MKVPDYQREDPQSVEQLQTFLDEVAQVTGVKASANLRPLVERMSRQVEFITQALSHRLTALDNGNTDIRTVGFAHLVPRFHQAEQHEKAGPDEEEVQERFFENSGHGEVEC